MSEAVAQRSWHGWAVAGLAAGGLVLLRLFEKQLVPILPVCPLHALTGLHCPGCGATRATRALLHGDIVAALHWNPLFVIALPLIAGLLLDARYSARPLNREAWFTWLMFGVIVLYGITRNLPFAPFTLLAPHAT